MADVQHTLTIGPGIIRQLLDARGKYVECATAHNKHDTKGTAMALAGAMEGLAMIALKLADTAEQGAQQMAAEQAQAEAKTVLHN